jgi:RNA polymerase sigma-70 factor (ECF subfamily)
MGEDILNQLENYREYLGLLGRLQLDEKLLGKVDVSGIIQVTFWEAARGDWSKLESTERLPWLRRVFANNLLDEIRKFRTQARDVEREKSLEWAIEQSASRLNQWLVCTGSSPSQHAMRAEVELRLAKALACLPESQRRAIELHYLQSWPLDRIGEHMKRTSGAVAALIYRGTTRLRELLTDVDGGMDGI